MYPPLGFRYRITSVASEFAVPGVVYFFTLLFAPAFISLCGPGCCYVFYSIFAIVSGLLMLGQNFISRCICFCVLI